MSLLASRSRTLRFLALLTAFCATASLRAQTPTLTLESVNAEVSGAFGTAVAAVEDIDGDGLADLAIGAPQENDGASDAGRVYVFSSADGTSLLTLESPNSESSGAFGDAVAGVPDVDGDGLGDLLIGAPREDGGAGNAGRAYLFSGTGALLLTLESTTPESNGFFGTSVAAVPDTDGDGLADLLVGAPEEDDGATNAGRLYLFSGDDGALLQQRRSPNPQVVGAFGNAVAGVPDTDGDGRGDLLVGAFQENAGADGAGRAYLLSGDDGSLLLTLESPNARPVGAFGASVAAVSDTNGDGVADLFIGADQEDAGPEGSGRAHLFSGADGSLLLSLVSPHTQPLGFFGHAVAGVPDVDGDGRGDLLVGAIQEDAGGERSGRAYLFGGADGASLLRMRSPNANVLGFFGNAVAGVPDTNGDGRGDLLIGAPQEDGGAGDAGRAYLVEGMVVLAAEGGPDAGGLDLGVTPNPTRSRTALAFTLSQPGPAHLRLFDALGREVAVLAAGIHGAGRHEVEVDAARLVPGVYLARLETSDAVAVRSLVIVR